MSSMRSIRMYRGKERLYVHLAYKLICRHWRRISMIFTPPQSQRPWFLFVAHLTRQHSNHQRVSMWGMTNVIKKCHICKLQFPRWVLVVYLFFFLFPCLGAIIRVILSCSPVNSRWLLRLLADHCGMWRRTCWPFPLVAFLIWSDIWRNVHK